MPRPGGNPDLKGGGKKGRSGRKSMPVEFAKAQAIIKAWNKVSDAVDEKDVKEIALPIALRDMTEKKDVNLSGSVSLTQIFNQSKEENTIQDTGV